MSSSEKRVSINQVPWERIVISDDNGLGIALF